MKYKLFNKIKNFRRRTWELIVLFSCAIIIIFFEIELTNMVTFIVCMLAFTLGCKIKRMVDKQSDNGD